ncbi:hypothetical protein LCM23_06505 [Cytobacillus kochii]|uniref:hypothetical protein n=1 Tax=Cytobacillus kochii TaxID=859143 RepID=UPI001CD57481|nr:hypothetical protein [Cytobacillus kochii]MCA1025737.1 hypothetical protein [Cytobacillus kochii]
MITKEHIQKTIVEGIVGGFSYHRIRMGDACVYTSYLTRDLMKRFYNLDVELVAGELRFTGLPIAYLWNPPNEFHMWAKKDKEIIDISIAALTQRDEFKKGNRFYKFKDCEIGVVWEEEPYCGQIYTEIEKGLNKIESPVDAEDYIDILNYAIKYIENYNR